MKLMIKGHLHPSKTQPLLFSESVLGEYFLCSLVWIKQHQGPVSERRLSENSEYVNPEMRETLGFPFQNGRFVKPGKAG